MSNCCVSQTSLFIKNCTFYVGNNPIENVDSFAHLGHVITDQLIDTADILKRQSDFVGQANHVLCFFNKLTSSVENNFFQSYCMSMYGCELWLLSNDHIKDLCVSWRKNLRRKWGLPYIQFSLLFASAAEPVLAVS